MTLHSNPKDLRHRRAGRRRLCLPQGQWPELIKLLLRFVNNASNTPSAYPPRAQSATSTALTKSTSRGTGPLFLPFKPGHRGSSAGLYRDCEQ
ncbi:hypothetical protein OF83DRAFT_99939 [Amylostereum chailletii]|nr:hypothetical protein OF83DRAFT_99939 [Amylostereum chailletii]